MSEFTYIYKKLAEMADDFEVDLNEAEGDLKSYIGEDNVRKQLAQEKCNFIRSQYNACMTAARILMEYEDEFGVKS